MTAASASPALSGPLTRPEHGSARLRTPALFLLDEFAALGRLEAAERAMGLMAGYGLQLWPILQDLSQLRDLYGTRANTFVANAGVPQVFGVNDVETARWLSQALGKATIGYETSTHRPGDLASTAEHVPGRELLTPDETMQLPASLQLLRLQGMPPVLAQKLRYYTDPEFEGLLTGRANARGGVRFQAKPPPRPSRHPRNKRHFCGFQQATRTGRAPCREGPREEQAMTGDPIESDVIPGSAEDRRSGVQEPAPALSDVGEKAMEIAGRKADEMKDELGKARDAAAERADATIDHAAADLSRAARALERAANDMEDGGTPQSLLQGASQGLMRVSDSMRGRSVSQLVGEVSEFGRRNPAAFLGAAALAGFALARFAVASEAEERASSADRGSDTGGRHHG